MANRRQYEIAFVGLKPGVHEFNYEIKDKFFVDYGDQDFSNCQAHVKLLLDKNSSFMMLKFEVGGTVDVVCDRCGNALTKDLWDEFNMVVKLVENPDEMNGQGHADSRVKRQIASSQSCDSSSRCRWRRLIGGAMIPAPWPAAPADRAGRVRRPARCGCGSARSWWTR